MIHWIGISDYLFHVYEWNVIGEVYERANEKIYLNMHSRFCLITFAVAISVFISKIEAIHLKHQPEEDLVYHLLKLYFPRKSVVPGALTRRQQSRYEELKRLSVSQQQLLYRRMQLRRHNYPALIPQLLFPDDFVLLEALTPTDESFFRSLQKLTSQEQKQLYKAMKQPIQTRYEKVVKTIKDEQLSQQEEPSPDPEYLFYYEKIIEALNIGQLIYEELLQQFIEHRRWPVSETTTEYALMGLYSLLKKHSLNQKWESESEEIEETLFVLKSEYRRLQELIKQ